MSKTKLVSLDSLDKLLRMHSDSKQRKFPGRGVVSVYFCNSTKQTLRLLSASLVREGYKVKEPIYTFRGVKFFITLGKLFQVD